MPPTRTRVLVAALFAAAGCDLLRDTPDPPGAADAGDTRPDAALVTPDAPADTIDARLVDGGNPDGGNPDGGIPDASGPDARPGDGPDGYPLPRTDVVPALGSADTFDVAAWNIRNLGTTAQGQQPTDVSLVADLIASMDLDLIAVEEIGSIDAWNELVARLPDHDARLSDDTYSDGTYQKIGFLYRSRVLRVNGVSLLFTRNGLEYPRPALLVRFTYDDGRHAALTFDAIGVHLKAGRTTDDYDRRRAAVGILDTYLRNQVDGGGETEVFVLGDFNDVLADAAGQATFANLLAAPDRYAFRTQSASDSGQFSFLPSSALLDHIVTTAGLADEAGAATVRIPRLDRDPDVTTYRATISDHLPVVMSLPMRPR